MVVSLLTRAGQLFLHYCSLNYTQWYSVQRPVRPASAARRTPALLYQITLVYSKSQVTNRSRYSSNTPLASEKPPRLSDTCSCALPTPLHKLRIDLSRAAAQMFHR